MATSRRLRGEPTEEEELARVLRESLLEAMLPVEQDSPSGDDVPVTQGLREDAVVTPEAELPMPGRKRKHAEDTSSYENAAATAKAIVDADLQLSVIRALSPVVRFSLPSDCVAFLEVGHLYRRVPILEEYGARVFKYPGDQNVLAQRLAVFNAHHWLIAAMAQRTTGLPTAATDSSLISKVTAPRVPSGECWESVREDQTRVFPLLTW